MGLMQLLKVGRSLGEARDRPHRYKLLNGVMPTFGRASGAVQKSELTERAADERKSGPAEIKTRVGGPTMNMEAAETMGKTPATNAFPTRRWALKGNPFKSSLRSAPRPVVQGEFALDKVKVVRNDLSDSDLELVAASKAGTAAGPASGNIFVGGLEAKKSSLLSRVKSRLFRAKAH
jgi:hypothetical protein